MVALDNSSTFADERHVQRIGLPGWVAMAAAALAFGGIVARGFAENGFRLASQLDWRFTCIVLFAALAGGPMARLLSRTRWATDGARLSRDLVWSFCASYGVYLASVLLPNMFGREGISPAMTLFVLFSGGVAAVMALAADEVRAAPFLNGPARRTVLGVAAIYFWMCYSLMALAHLSGPHRPDGFYGFSLCLMIAALLIRFADRFTTVLGSARPGSTHPV